MEMVVGKKDVGELEASVVCMAEWSMLRLKHPTMKRDIEMVIKTMR